MTEDGPKEEANGPPQEAAGQEAEGIEPCRAIGEDVAALSAQLEKLAGR